MISKQETKKRASELKQLSYTDTFKRLLKEHGPKHLLRRFLELEFKLEKMPLGSTIEDGPLKVTSKKENDEIQNKFFKVEVGSYKFFVKIEERWHEESVPFSGHNAIAEIDSSIEARKLLKDLPWVEVVDFQMAFRNLDRNYFVSRWYDLPTFDEYLDRFTDQKTGSINIGVLKRLNDKLSKIKKNLEPRGFQDINFSNAFYDEVNNKVVLFDLHRGVRWEKLEGY